MKRKTSTKAAIAAALLGTSTGGWAIGLGPARLHAVLGQSLEVTVPVRLEDGEQLAPECVEAKVFFGDQRLPAGQVRTRLDGSAAGERLLRISTIPGVDEPVVSIVVTTGCSVAVAREFVAFADPPSGVQPVQMPAVAAVPAAAAVAAAPSGRATASRGSASDGRAQPPSLQEQAPPSRPRTKAPSVESMPAPAAGLAVVAAASTEPKAAAPRLRLEPVLPLQATPAPVADREGAASTPGGEPGERPAPEAARVQALELTLADLRSELALTRQSLQALESRDREAAQVREAHPLLYALGGFSLALAAAVGWLLVERRRDRAMAAVWNEPLEPRSRAPMETAAQPSSALPGSARTESEPVFWMAGTAPAVVPQLVPSSPFPTVEPGSGPDSTPAASASGKNASTLEDLLDLDQQSAFLVALGQEEAAIELLQSHVGQDPAGSLLPWLELLALHQRRGNRPAFEREASRFAGRFACIAPAWEADLDRGGSLEDDPALIERLERLWHSTEDTVALLESLLLGGDARGGAMPDLPACRDLLLLYAVVRYRGGSEAGTPAARTAVNEGLLYSEATPSRALAMPSLSLLHGDPWTERLDSRGAKADPVAEAQDVTKVAAHLELPELEFEPMEFQAPNPAEIVIDNR
ncbi:hypothetical protein [Caldimonas tepidiphila]|uniref:hypothetical protein n=1 Tax=Caldimonas tepidiphila TaxID=2315841 RepID=UPI000E5B2DF2|nr:hypothetical protein [Caldimonas tepidiphila]